MRVRIVMKNKFNLVVLVAICILEQFIWTPLLNLLASISAISRNGILGTKICFLAGFCYASVVLGSLIMVYRELGENTCVYCKIIEKHGHLSLPHNKYSLSLSNRLLFVVLVLFVLVMIIYNIICMGKGE